MDISSLNAQERSLLARAQQAVHEVEPAAQILLFGSRARGEAAPDSDWDLLIVLEGPVDHGREARIRRRLYDLELEADAIISTIILGATEWDSPLSRATPFHVSVARDALAL